MNTTLTDPATPWTVDAFDAQEPGTHAPRLGLLLHAPNGETIPLAPSAEQAAALHRVLCAVVNPPRPHTPDEITRLTRIINPYLPGGWTAYRADDGDPDGPTDYIELGRHIHTQVSETAWEPDTEQRELELDDLIGVIFRLHDRLTQLEARQ